MRELILGGQKSGKSRTAELRAAQWLRQPGHEALLIATALAGDAEMTQRIARHRRERSARLPALPTLEVADGLAAALGAQSSPRRLLVVDCLTLWLTQLMLPPGSASPPLQRLPGEIDVLVAAVAAAPGPLVLVSNEIGLGVTPASPEARAVVDALGVLHQRIATHCERVTLMVAGIECPIRGAGGR